MAGSRTTGTRALTPRRLGALVGAGAILVSAACLPEQPPPVNLISSVSASSGVAGQLTTITVVVRDDAPGDTATLVLGEGAGPATATMPRSTDPDTCRFGAWPAQVAPTAGGSALSITCRLPERMVNGPWLIPVSARGSFGYTTGVQLPLIVTGGTDDLEPPVVTILAPQPPTVARGGSFTMAYRIEDPNVAPNDHLYPHWFQRRSDTMMFLCEGANDQFQVTQVSPTVVEASFVCTVPATMSPGLYNAYTQYGADIHGRTTPIGLTLTVT